MQEFDVITRIQELCEARSWTYYRLAKESEIPYSTLNTMLRKTNVPSVPTLMKLCHGFGITLSAFFDDADESAKLRQDELACLEQWNLLDAKSLHSSICRAYLTGKKNPSMRLQLNPARTVPMLT